MRNPNKHKPVKSEKQTKIAQDLRDMNQVDEEYRQAENEYYDSLCKQHDDHRDSKFWSELDESWYW